MDGVTSSVDFSYVFVARRPHDCKFWTAPVGIKHCEYRAQVLSVLFRDVSSILSQRSLDGGKTWQVAPIQLDPIPWRFLPDAGPPVLLSKSRILVSWVKVEK
jgi:hypothetical protein